MLPFDTMTVAMAYIMKLHTFFWLILFVGLNGCADPLNHLAYHPDILQGNIVTPQQVKKLTVGMTQAEVIQIVGTPLLTDPFHADRWDYLSRTTSENDDTIQTHFIVFFNSDQKVVSVQTMAST